MASPKEKLEDAEERAKLSLDLDGLESTPVASPDRSKIEEISETSGFKSRAQPKTQPTKSPTKPKTKARKRRTTGRTYPFNTKIKPEAYQLLGDLADTLSETEGRPVSMAEVLERALDTFDTSLKS